jgi:arylsulfatase A-like enzyme
MFAKITEADHRLFVCTPCFAKAETAKGGLKPIRPLIGLFREMARLVLIFTVLFGLSINATADETDAPQYPNIILIIADDLGYRDLGSYGAPDIPTPNLDRLADEGIQFSEAYATYPYCGPSRAGIFTGRYQQRFGFDMNVQFSESGLPISEKTLAATLKHYGYATALVGKWHLGRPTKFHPLNRGFDEFYGHLEGMRSYYTNESLSPEEQADRWLVDPVYDMWKEIEFDGYITDRFSEKVTEIIAKGKNSPFFITLAYNAPHDPIEEPPSKYLDRISEEVPLKRRHYAATVNAIDEGVGGIVSELKKQGMYENTMIFFISDHGGIPWANNSSNGELTGFKDLVYEGGIRTPFIFHWGKDQVNPSAASQPVSTLDIFSTIMAAVDPAYNQSHLDGTDLLQENLSAILEQRPLFWSVDGGQQRAIRIGKHKLVQLFHYPAELYDLSISPVEDHLEGVKLAKIQDVLARSMLETLWAWQGTLPEPRIGGRRNPDSRFEPSRKLLRLE